VGLKYSDAWHFNHMYEPTSISPGSLMPAYPWLLSDQMDLKNLEATIRVMRQLGVPYAEGYEKQALADLQKQAAGIADRINTDLKTQNVQTLDDREIIALIAYLQRLGTDVWKTPEAVTPAPIAAPDTTKGMVQVIQPKN
jgi:cytochrome c oxidase cbb3-type subunit I/II